MAQVYETPASADPQSDPNAQPAADPQERTLFIYGCVTCPVELAIRGTYTTVEHATPGLAVVDADIPAIGTPDLRRLAGRSACPVCGNALYFKRAQGFTPPSDPIDVQGDGTEPIQQDAVVAPSGATSGDAQAFPQAPASVYEDQSQQPQEAPSAGPEAASVEPTDQPAVNATPAAQAHADELGVDLSTVDGSGKDGTVTKADVTAAADAATAPDTSPAPEDGGAVEPPASSDTTDTTDTSVNPTPVADSTGPSEPAPTDAPADQPAPEEPPA